MPASLTEADLAALDRALKRLPVTERTAQARAHVKIAETAQRLRSELDSTPLHERTEEDRQRIANEAFAALSGMRVATRSPFWSDPAAIANAAQRREAERSK